MGGVGGVLDRGGLWNFKEKKQILCYEAGIYENSVPDNIVWRLARYDLVLWKAYLQWKSCQQFFTPLKPEKKSVLRNQLPIQATTLSNILNLS